MMALLGGAERLEEGHWGHVSGGYILPGSFLYPFSLLSGHHDVNCSVPHALPTMMALKL
jgi:hypothetical protein